MCFVCVCVVEGNKAAVELLTLLLLLLVHMILLQLLDEFGKLILCGQWTGIVGATGATSARAATHLVRIARATGASTGPHADRRLVRVHVVVHFTTGTGRRWRMGRQMVR